MQRAIFSLIFFALFFSPTLQSSDFSQTSIVLIGDSGKDNEGQLKVSEALQDLCQKEVCDLGILAGDNVYPKGVSSRTDNVLERAFDRYYNPLKIPFLVALGNHDYGGFFLNKKKASYQLLHAKKNPNFVLPHYWYTHETPHAVFAVIDTTRLMWARDIKVQARMVEQANALAHSKSKWFMVVGHHPLISNGTHGNAGRYERRRFPFFVSGKYVKRFLRHHVCGKAHFYLAGHDHSLQIFDGNKFECNTELIVSGAAASVTKFMGNSEARYAGLELGFFHLNVSRDEVRVRALNETSQVRYEGTFSKAPEHLAMEGNIFHQISP